tara:strand:- start:3234 stop:3848 length:615 start_codon:yes stop_codon:yes gene_type:complete
MNLFFLDFETTGLNPYYNDPIEIAIKQYNSENYYQSFMIPNQMISSKITDITHITNEIIKNEGQEKFKVIKDCIDFIKENSSRGPIYLIAHNGNSFDFLIFKKIIKDYNQKYNDNPIEKRIINRFKYIDSLLLSKLFLKEERVNQPGLCRRYNICNDMEHRAIGDVNALEKLYIILCEQYSHSKSYNYNYYLERPEKLMDDCLI